VSLPVVAIPLAATAPLADSDAGKGSPIGLFVVLLLVVATYLLYRSMAGHLRRLPERFPGYRGGEPAKEGEPAGAGAEPAEGAAVDAAEPAGGAVVPADPDATATEAAAGSASPARENGERTGPS